MSTIRKRSSSECDAPAPPPAAKRQEHNEEDNSEDKEPKNNIKDGNESDARILEVREVIKKEPTDETKHDIKDDSNNNTRAAQSSERSNSQPVSAWKPPAVKRTEQERSIGYPGAVVPENLKHSRDDFMRDNIVLRNGPNGPPVYDRLGYQLDYRAIKRGSYPRRPSVKAITARMEADEKRNKRIREIMGQPDNKNGLMDWAWQDKVARDLDIPYHTVGLPEFEEWHRRGLRLQPGELVEKPSREEIDRLMELATGSALRVGYNKK